MGQYWSDRDQQITEACSVFYDAIWELRNRGIPDYKIQVGMAGELLGLADIIRVNTEMEVGSDGGEYEDRKEKGHG